MPMDNDYTGVPKNHNIPLLFKIKKSMGVIKEEEKEIPKHNQEESTEYNPTDSYIKHFENLDLEAQKQIIRQSVQKRVRNIISLRKKGKAFLEEELRDFFSSGHPTYISTDHFPDVIQEVMQFLKEKSKKYTIPGKIEYTLERVKKSINKDTPEK